MTEESLITDALNDGREKMEKVIAHTASELAAFRTGRAAPALVEKIKVDYYGTETPLQQLAGFTVPEARQLVIHPYDKNSLSAIEKALQSSDLGINPSNDGQVIRLIFPQLNEERRKELIKLVRHKGEEGKVAIRNIRRTIRQELEAFEKEGKLSTDDLERAEKELETVTHEFTGRIDVLLAHKEQELLEV